MQQWLVRTSASLLLRVLYRRKNITYSYHHSLRMQKCSSVTVPIEKARKGLSWISVQKCKNAWPVGELNWSWFKNTCVNDCEVEKGSADGSQFPHLISLPLAFLRSNQTSHWAEGARSNPIRMQGTSFHPNEQRNGPGRKLSTSRLKSLSKAPGWHSKSQHRSFNSPSCSVWIV